MRERESIIVEPVESWIEVTINRPEDLNAIREQTASELLEKPQGGMPVTLV
jgi:enoyl-CoA hydratase/carnithine racemase